MQFKVEHIAGKKSRREYEQNGSVEQEAVGNFPEVLGCENESDKNQSNLNMLQSLPYSGQIDDTSRITAVRTQNRYCKPQNLGRRRKRLFDQLQHTAPEAIGLLNDLNLSKDSVKKKGSIYLANNRFFEHWGFT